MLSLRKGRAPVLDPRLLCFLFISPAIMLDDITKTTSKAIEAQPRLSNANSRTSNSYSNSGGSCSNESSSNSSSSNSTISSARLAPEWHQSDDAGCLTLPPHCLLATPSPPLLPHLWLLPSQLLVVATAGLCKRYASLSALLARAHT